MQAHERFPSSQKTQAIFSLQIMPNGTFFQKNVSGIFRTDTSATRI
jgi:hypothetical protein